MAEKLKLNRPPIRKALDEQIKWYNYLHGVEKPCVIEMSAEAYEALANEMGITPHFYKGSMVRVVNSTILEKFDKAINEYTKYAGRKPKKIQMTEETLDAIKHELTKKFVGLLRVPSQLFRNPTHNDCFLYGIKVEVIDGR